MWNNTHDVSWVTIRLLCWYFMISCFLERRQSRPDFPGAKVGIALRYPKAMVTLPTP